MWEVPKERQIESTRGEGMSGEEGRLPEVNRKRCTGCGRCVAACPLRLFTLEVSGYRKNAVLGNPAACTGCGNCIEACPVGALGWKDEGEWK
jgi:NAD-dependent dihydropyrimidine dehydrogenase PreA subunit